MNSNEPLFLRNATVFDGAKTLVEPASLLLEDGRIQAVGPDADLSARAKAAGARTHDCAGAFVMPGITDAHIHVSSLGAALERVDLAECASAEACAALLAERAAQTPPGEWIQARGWRKSIWACEAFPTASILDAAVPDHPVYCRSLCGHSGWANSLAMKLAEVTASTPEVAGGEITRNPDGTPTGIFKETAMGLIGKVVPVPDAQERKRWLLQTLKHANELGITGVHDMSGFDDFTLAAECAKAGELTVRYGGAARPNQVEQGAAAYRETDPTALARLLGTKMFIDGALNSQTAAMLEPYVDEHGADTENLGILTQEYAELRDRVAESNGAGLPVLVHAIGDKGIRWVLNAIEEAGDTALCNRIEHASVLADGDLQRMARLRVHASVQPSHVITDIPTCDRHLGPARCARTSVFKDMANAGVNMAFGSDAPVVSADPRDNFFAAVLRTELNGNPEGGWYPAQLLSLEQTLSCCCLGPSRSTGAEKVQGRVAPGFCADLTVFAENPFDRDPAELRTLPLLMTIVDGRVVHQSA